MIKKTGFVFLLFFYELFQIETHAAFRLETDSKYNKLN